MYTVFYMNDKYQFSLLDSGRWLMEEFKLKDGNFHPYHVYFDVNKRDPFKMTSFSTFQE
jgi:hypothetical protein